MLIPVIVVFAAVVVLGFIVMTMYNGLVKAACAYARPTAASTYSSSAVSA